MEEFKLDRLKQLDKDIKDKVSGMSGDGIKHRLIQSFNLPQNSTGQDVVIKIQESASIVPGLNALSDSFDLNNTVREFGVDLPLSVYLNWRHFETIDKIDFNILCLYFDDIWYPSSDDVDIIDEGLGWIISVDHVGYLKFLRLRIN